MDFTASQLDHLLKTNRAARRNIEAAQDRRFAEGKAANPAHNDRISFLTEIIDELETYGNELVDRVSAQDGKTVCKVARRNVGTVNDPGMERYWTM